MKSNGGYFAPVPPVSKDAFGLKLASFYPGNADLGIHTHNAIILLFKPETGEPPTIMEGALGSPKSTPPPFRERPRVP